MSHPLLDFSFQGEYTGIDKTKITSWIKDKLTALQGEEPEDLFLEYVNVMIFNKKTMNEISNELKDFVGEDEALDFALNLGSELKLLVPIVKEVISTTKTENTNKQNNIQTKSKNNSSKNAHLDNTSLSSSSSNNNDKRKSNNNNNNQASSKSLQTSTKSEPVKSNISGVKRGSVLDRISNMNQESSKKSRSNDDNRNHQQDNNSSSSSSSSAAPPPPIPTNLNPMTAMMEQMASLASMPGFSDVIKMQQEMMAKMMAGGTIGDSTRGIGGRRGAYVPRGRSIPRGSETYRGRSNRGRGGYIADVAPFAKDTPIEEQKVSIDMVMSERPAAKSKIAISDSEPLGVDAYDEEFNKEYVYSTRGRGGSRGGSSFGRGRGRFSNGRGKGSGRTPIEASNLI